MTDFEYRTGIKAYANSDLSELARLIGGKPKFPPNPIALLFGTMFHLLVLEPDKFNPAEMYSEFLPNLYGMQKAVIQEPGLQALLDKSQKEVVKTWHDLYTGLPCKCRIDSLPTERHIIDLKTTSASSYEEFLASCYSFGYDQQAAFYLSSNSSLRFFELVGVQKVPPYNVYRVPFSKSSHFVQKGAMKVARLMQLAQKQAEKGIWFPSSWSRQEAA